MGEENSLNRIKDFINQNVIAFPLPTKKGKWADEVRVGNSAFILDDNIQVKWRKNGKEFSCNGAKLKQWMDANYGVNTIIYSHNEPDFYPFADKEIGVIKLENMPISRGKSYAFANSYAAKILSQKYGRKVTVREVQKRMSDRELTWHECGDRKTMIAIPTRINAVFTHMGGIGVEKSYRAVHAVWKHYPSTLKLLKIEGRRFVGSKQQLHRSIGNRRLQYRRMLREIK